MASEQLKEIIFYSLEKAIKTYRQFAQKRLEKAGYKITIDQWLVLKTLNDDSEITQRQIGKIVFKDYASITRIIELLVNKKYITRSFHSQDRRRFSLMVTREGKKLLEELQPVINDNRIIALKGISKLKIEELQNELNQIISNCTI